MTGISEPHKKRLKTLLTRQFYLWHWVSSAICLASMLLFTFTGITLNHAADIPAKPVTKEQTYTLPASYMEQLQAASEEEAKEAPAEVKKPLPGKLAAHLGSQFEENLRNKSAEWSEDEIYLSLPRPGGDAWLSIERASGVVTYERTTRGVISFLNDLHKGRHTGPVWSWFIDIFSIAAFIFTLTGLGLLWVHARRRPSTWPVVLLGVLLPIILVLFFIH
ncbi:hypothetical protein DES53_1011000 [Roseimicrobium gellanilyticum]|uniref:PepSY-associated transmembrane protein n=1 Tax=Roseimicrobium gellanilyticum TaxID=748857 RepID=A0A366HWB3_9BACT|nr:PepSY-associated TM helix domain-containing protein [Roseimicrobium gellanilyticum]RBP48200.1 hypothetical protein DES53_1011000 [Roseimicrobium gellanilyticum]